MKIVEILEKIMEIHRFKNIYTVFVCAHKMVEISAETFAENCIHTITQLRKGKDPILWIRVRDIGRELDVKNIFDLVDKEIKGRFETNYPTEQQIRNYKRHGSEFFEGIKFIYAHECIMIL